MITLGEETLSGFASITAPQTITTDLVETDSSGHSTTMAGIWVIGLGGTIWHPPQLGGGGWGFGTKLHCLLLPFLCNPDGSFNGGGGSNPGDPNDPNNPSNSQKPTSSPSSTSWSNPTTVSDCKAVCSTGEATGSTRSQSCTTTCSATVTGCSVTGTIATTTLTAAPNPTETPTYYDDWPPLSVFTVNSILQQSRISEQRNWATALPTALFDQPGTQTPSTTRQTSTPSTVQTPSTTPTSSVLCFPGYV